MTDPEPSHVLHGDGCRWRIVGEEEWRRANPDPRGDGMVNDHTDDDGTHTDEKRTPND